MAKSKGFVLYHDMLDSFARLDTDSERWQLLTALIHYSANDCQDSNDDYSNLSPMAQGMYIAMTAPIRAQYQQYERICERNRSNRTKSDATSQTESPVVPVVPMVPNAPVVPVVPNAPVVPVVTNKQNKINKQNKQTVRQENNKSLTYWGDTKPEIVANLKTQIKTGPDWDIRNGTIWDTLADEIIDIVADRLILSAQGPYIYEGATYDHESTAKIVAHITPGILHNLVVAYKRSKSHVKSPPLYIWSAIIEQVRQRKIPYLEV